MSAHTSVYICANDDDGGDITYSIVLLKQNRPPNRVNTTERLAALRLAMQSADVQAFLMFNRDEHGVSDVIVMYRLVVVAFTCKP